MGWVVVEGAASEVAEADAVQQRCVALEIEEWLPVGAAEGGGIPVQVGCVVDLAELPRRASPILRLIR